MSRTLLLILCDFLLLSILSLARFDAPAQNPVAPAPDKASLATPAHEDILALLEMALEAERHTREDLDADRQRTREDLENTRQQLHQTRAQAESLNQHIATLDKEQRQIIATLEHAQSQTQSLSEDLVRTRDDMATTRERLRQAELQSRERLKQLDQERRTREAVEHEKRLLATRLEIAESEKSLLATNLAASQAEKATLLSQTQELTQGVTTLAESTTQIREEVRLLQPQTANRLFDDYLGNAIRIEFTATLRGLLGTIERTTSTPSIIWQAPDRQLYAIIHAANTPFGLDRNTGRLEALKLAITTDGTTYTHPTQIHLLAADPRILAIPLPDTFATDTRTFPTAAEPLRHPTAIIINPDNRFGESLLKLLPQSTRHLRRETRLISNLPGEISPSTGALVFAKTGELLGLMIDANHAVLLDTAAIEATITLGEPLDIAGLENALLRGRNAAANLPPRAR